MSDSRAISTILDMDGAFARVKTVSDYRGLLRARIKSGRVKQELPQTGPLYADIDCGAWTALCHCNSGVALHPDWDYAACLNCGRTWTSIVFPDAALMAAIQRVLDLRPTGQRSPTRFYKWLHTETLADLVRENRRYGWPVPEAM